MGQRGFLGVLLLTLAMAGAVSGCFTTQLVRTDTTVSYALLRAPIEPPPVPDDAVVMAPSPAPTGSTWMEPYWQWYGGHYTWIVGRWIPTLAGYAFLQPRWSPSRGEWAFSAGGWADPSGHIVAAPPAVALREPAATCPAPEQVVVAEPAPAPSHARLDHTVTLGHRYYDVAPRESDEQVSASSVTTRGAHRDGHGSTSTYASGTSSSTTSGGYVVVSPSYRSYAAPSYGGRAPSSSYAAPSAPSTGYATGHSSAPTSSSSMSMGSPIGASSGGSRGSFTIVRP